MTTPSPSDMPGAPHAPAFLAPTAPTTVESATTDDVPGDAPGAPQTHRTRTRSDRQPDTRPPWEKNGEPFDPERAWKQIQNMKTELADYKTRTDPIVAEREQLRRASQTDLDRANEDLTQANTTAETWRTQAIRSKAEALATGRFVDAETALALIGDVSVFVAGDEIDIAKLTARLDQLAADKPFLVAAPAAPPGFAPNRAQGQSGTGGATSLDEQIRAAEKSGNLSLSIALKSQKHAQLRQQTR